VELPKLEHPNLPLYVEPSCEVQRARQLDASMLLRWSAPLVMHPHEWN
jgi:hypothetical protein